MPKPKTFSCDAMQPPQGTMPVMQFCLPDQLEIDPRYQRSIENGDSQALIAEIAANWHWGRAQLLTVARRDGKLFVVDGQRRLAAAKLRGDIQQLPCLIEEFADVAEEAALFNDLNDRRRPVSAIDKFRAAVVAGDADCIAIAAAMERAGLALAPHSNPTAWKPGQVANIGGIRGAWKTHGPAATELALTLMADTFQGAVLTYAGTIFPGLVAVCAGRPGEGVIGDVDLSRLMQALGRKTQEQWRAAVLKEMAASGVGRVVAMAFALREAMAFEAGRPGGATPESKYRGKALELATKPGAPAADGNCGVTTARPPAPLPPIKAPPAAAAPMPIAVGGAAAFGDRFDRRATGDQFCAQCDKLVSPERAKRCQSAWCKVRDVAA